MPITIADLLAHQALDARLLTPEPTLPMDPVTWVHNSDLLDPTPWLSAGQVLLTDGLQFVGVDDPAVFEAYVARLRTRGILALGHSTHVVHDVVPQPLITACTHAGLPLFSVSQATPFIAFVQLVASALAEDQRAELDWSLQAQRAIVRAALRPDGLDAVLREVRRQLGCWVVMFDAGTQETHADTDAGLSEVARERIRREAERLLRDGRRAVSRLDLDGTDVTFQTIGQHNRLRGVIALGAAQPLGPHSGRVIESVIAIASIALEQSHLLNAARMNLRSGLVELLLAGSVDTAQTTAVRIWGGFPSSPVRVLVCPEPHVPQQLQDELELQAMHARGRVFFARRARGEFVLIAAAQDFDEYALRVSSAGLCVGISSAGDWPQLQQLHGEAVVAARLSTRERPVVRFEQVHGSGFLSLLESDAATAFTHRLLEPLRVRPDGDELIDSAHAWLEANGTWDPASRALGIHRHTLRARIDLIEQLTGCRLSTAAGRFELWTALQLERGSTPPTF